MLPNRISTDRSRRPRREPTLTDNLLRRAPEDPESWAAFHERVVRDRLVDGGTDDRSEDPERPDELLPDDDDRTYTGLRLEPSRYKTETRRQMPDSIRGYFTSDCLLDRCVDEMIRRARSFDPEIASHEDLFRLILARRIKDALRRVQVRRGAGTVAVDGSFAEREIELGTGFASGADGEQVELIVDALETRSPDETRADLMELHLLESAQEFFVELLRKHGGVVDWTRVTRHWLTLLGLWPAYQAARLQVGNQAADSTPSRTSKRTRAETLATYLRVLDAHIRGEELDTIARTVYPEATFETAQRTARRARERAFDRVARAAGWL